MKTDAQTEQEIKQRFEMSEKILNIRQKYYKKYSLEVQTSHHAIDAHRLVVLAEVNTMSQYWGNLFFKLSLAEALEEVTTRVAEEAWLYNEYAFNICFDYIHRFIF